MGRKTLAQSINYDWLL